MSPSRKSRVRTTRSSLPSSQPPRPTCKSSCYVLLLYYTYILRLAPTSTTRLAVNGAEVFVATSRPRCFASVLRLLDRAPPTLLSASSKHFPTLVCRCALDSQKMAGVYHPSSLSMYLGLCSMVIMLDVTQYAVCCAMSSLFAYRS